MITLAAERRDRPVITHAPTPLVSPGTLHLEFRVFSKSASCERSGWDGDPVETAP